MRGGTRQEENLARCWRTILVRDLRRDCRVIILQVPQRPHTKAPHEKEKQIDHQTTAALVQLFIRLEEGVVEEIWRGVLGTSPSTEQSASRPSARYDGSL